MGETIARLRAERDRACYLWQEDRAKLDRLAEAASNALEDIELDGYAGTQVAENRLRAALDGLDTPDE